jgi:hypothetical protein
MDREREVLSRHLAFLVSEAELDETFDRIRQWNALQIPASCVS